MELDAHKPRVTGKFNDLDQFRLGIDARWPQPRLLEPLQIVVIEFVAVAMTLADLIFAVNLVRLRVALEFAGVSSQPHRAPLVGDGLLGFHHADDRVGRVRLHLGRVGVGNAHHVAGVLDDGHLHP